MTRHTTPRTQPAHKHSTCLRRRSRWRWDLLAATLLVFAVTRVLPAVLTLHPELYGPDISNPAGDVARYAAWGTAAIGDGLVPYRDFAVEYPPGVLPFVLAPALLGRGTFSVPAFVALLVAVDTAALLALWVLRGRGASSAGVVAWLVLPPALGVVLYGRLDLLPAVAVVLSLERANARRWTASGVWLGLGAAAKLVPALFLPLLLLAAGRRWPQALGGAVAGIAVAWLPYLADTPALWRNVVGYHAARGIHLESLWGSALNLWRLRGGPADLQYEYGAFGITAADTETIVLVSTLVAGGIVAGVTSVAGWRWRRYPECAQAELALAVTAMLALLLAGTRVLSPQFVVWLLGAAAVAIAVTPGLWRWMLPGLGALVLLTVLGYPIGFDLLLQGAAWPAVVLVARNLLLLGLGVALIVRWLSTAPSSGIARERAHVTAVPASAAPQGRT